jgi:hypothetical protein
MYPGKSAYRCSRSFQSRGHLAARREERVGGVDDEDGGDDHGGERAVDVALRDRGHRPRLAY